MTALGKMLVFLVLLLSLVWNGLVVNAYVTRTNWKDQAAKAQAKAVEAADAANNLRKLLDAEREASEEKTRAVSVDRDRLYAQLDTANRELAKAQKAYEDRIAADAAVGRSAQTLLEERTALQEQVRLLTASLGEREKSLTALTGTTEAARADMVRAQLERDSQTRRAEQLQDRVRELQERLQQAQNGTGGLPGQRSAVAPPGFRGTVRSYTRDGYIAMEPGADAGLQPNAVLTLQRLSGATGKYLGQVRIVSANPKDAVGRFEPAPGLRAEDFPRAGDELTAR